jgi:hypothetical protein
MLEAKTVGDGGRRGALAMDCASELSRAHGGTT